MAADAPMPPRRRQVHRPTGAPRAGAAGPAVRFAAACSHRLVVFWEPANYVWGWRMIRIIFWLMRAKRHSCQGMNVRRKSVKRVGRVT
jgi:hypothetical protein